MPLVLRVLRQLLKIDIVFVSSKYSPVLKAAYNYLDPSQLPSPTVALPPQPASCIA